MQVDAHHPIPVRIARFFNGLKKIDASIIEQQTDRAELRLDLICGLFHCDTGRHIDLHTHDALIVECFQGLFDGVLTDVGNGDFAAFGEQSPNEANTDAVSAAGDEGRASRKVDHAFNSF